LGDPGSANQVSLPAPDQQVVNAAVAVSKSPQKLAIKLLSLLFSKEQIAGGICIPDGSSTRVTLDQAKIEGIRRMLYISPKYCILFLSCSTN